MASKPKTKQSSIHSFVVIPGTPPPKRGGGGSSPPSSSSSSPSDYERVRHENILKNQAFLKSLGIAASTPPPNAVARRKRRLPDPAVPLRRSTRMRGLPLEDSPGEAGDPTDRESESPPELQPPEFSDSAVFHYLCEARRDGGGEGYPSLVPSSSPIMGFRTAGIPLRDPSLTKIYSIDASFLEDDRCLIAAGGHGGWVSVFGGGEGAALVSWKASRSWISGVLFVGDNDRRLLASSSNDGSVVVWDIEKQPIVAVVESKGLHSGGIFSMDCSGGHLIATASKDSSVALARLLSEGELIVDRRISGHHSGVIRGICFRKDANVLADGGADGRICILDARSPAAPSLAIETQHSAGVNTVEWCESDDHLLLSAGKGPALLLYDVRSPGEPLRRLEGHLDARRHGSIYQPCFVDGGGIATPGPGSGKLTLYRVSTGEVVSRGEMEQEANLVKCFGDGVGRRRVWAAGRYVEELLPFSSAAQEV